MEQTQQTIKILLKRPHEPWCEAKIPNTLAAMQDAVGGLIEAVRIHTDAVIICNEEGLIRGMPYNARVMGTNFCGPIFVCGVDGEEFADTPITLKNWLRFWIGGGV